MEHSIAPTDGPSTEASYVVSNDGDGNDYDNDNDNVARITDNNRDEDEDVVVSDVVDLNVDLSFLTNGRIYESTRNEKKEKMKLSPGRGGQ